ncbi:TPA: hypothetical protein DEB00_01970 [Candidatus Uhrbacteria bacterium]|nr:hypothetical protein [Candidatus Uhrbacteria bacterium]
MPDGKGFYFENVIIHVGDMTVELEHVRSTSKRLQRLMEQGYEIAASLEFTVSSNRQVATQLGLLQYMPEDDEEQVAGTKIADESEDPIPSNTELSLQNTASNVPCIEGGDNADQNDLLAVKLDWHHMEVLRRGVNEHYRGYELPQAVRSFAHVAGHRYWYQIMDDLAQYQKSGHRNPLIEPFNEVLRPFGLSVSTDIREIRRYLPT